MTLAAETELPEALDVEPEATAAPDEAPEADLEEDDSLEGLLSRGLEDQDHAAQVQAPEHWSDADKAILSRLPDDAARTAVLDWRKQIETGAQAKFDEAAHGRKVAEALDEYLRPLGIERQGHADAVKRLLAADRALRTDPVQALAGLIGGAGIAGTQQAELLVRSLAQTLGVTLGGSQGQAEVDPQAARIQALEAHLMQRKQAERRYCQQQLDAQVRSADQAIADFRDAKATDGQAAHPHFDRVKSTIGAVLQAAAAAGESLDLKQAYERAVWAHPDLRAEAMKAEQARTAAAEAEARRQAVAKAKGARTPKTANVSVRDAAGDDDLEALLAAGMREMAA